MALLKSIRNAWNVFAYEDSRRGADAFTIGTGYTSRPDKTRLRFYNDRSIVSAIYTRIAIDVASVALKHVKVDEKTDRYLEDLDSTLQSCLSLEPNIDQGPRQFRQDLVMTLIDKGHVAIVPIETSDNPNTNEKYDIYSLRVGEITEWHPRHIRVYAYNELTGNREYITVEKRYTAIVENPFYTVMNESNSILQRLIRKLHLLDLVDEQSGSGKLDLIIQLPYVIKSEARRTQAEQRRKDIEVQLKDSKYGIAYTDGTEKITQLNRATENNLMGQIEYLLKTLYGQLGITEDIMNGTANEETMLNYRNRTVEPIVESIMEAMQRSFIGPLGTRKGERIVYFRDPFKFTPLQNVAEIADKFTRNEILTSNEIRSYLGIPPSNDAKADKLMNSNMPQPAPVPAGPSLSDMDAVMKEVFDGLGKDIDALIKDK